MRKKTINYLVTFCFIGITAILCHFLEPFIGYRTVGFVFLMAVLVSGVTGSKGMVFFSAILGAASWNFFFIPPKFTLTINNADDFLMYLAFVIVALIAGYLTRRINEAQRLKDSEALHQTLLNTISHELRTPLTAILGATAALEDETMIAHVHYIKTINKGLQVAANRLNQVIENLLDMNRLNSGMLSLNTDWHELNDLIGVVRNKLTPTLEKHHLSIQTPEEMPLLKIDFRLMDHALSNLLLNAIMYSRPESEIKLIVTQSKQTLSIQVGDEGPGLPENSIDQLFDKFYRAPGSPPGGTGLGLSIVKSIVELHHGTIEASNNAMGGAEFTIRLPIQEQPLLPLEPQS